MRKYCQQVFSVLQSTTNASIRTIAKLTGIPRSTVQRYQAGMASRNQYPESHLWEREEGYQWLCRLVFATVYVFGIMRGVGAETISYFSSCSISRFILVFLRVLSAPYNEKWRRRFCGIRRSRKPPDSAVHCAHERYVWGWMKPFFTRWFWCVWIWR